MQRAMAVITVSAIWEYAWHASVRRMVSPSLRGNLPIRSLRGLVDGLHRGRLRDVARVRGSRLRRRQACSRRPFLLEFQRGSPRFSLRCAVVDARRAHTGSGNTRRTDSLALALRSPLRVGRRRPSQRRRLTPVGGSHLAPTSHKRVRVFRVGRACSTPAPRAGDTHRRASPCSATGHV